MIMKFLHLEKHLLLLDKDISQTSSTVLEPTKDVQKPPTTFWFFQAEKCFIKNPAVQISYLGSKDIDKAVTGHEIWHRDPKNGIVFDSKSLKISPCILWIAWFDPCNSGNLYNAPWSFRNTVRKKKPNISGTNEKKNRFFGTNFFFWKSPQGKLRATASNNCFIALRF